MPQPATHFTWIVATAGYRWLDTESAGLEAKPGRWLTADQPAGGARVYRPLLEHSGLCRILADTEPTEVGVLAFADQFGLLGAGDAMIQVQATPAGALVGTGETLAVWQRQIGRLRMVIELWEAAVAGDVERLAQHILWAPDASWVAYDTHAASPPESGPRPLGWGRETIWRLQIDGPAGEALKVGDLVRPAFMWVGQKVNEVLKEEVSPQLRWNADRTALSLQLVPRSLAGALWLQLASAIERGVLFRRCAECGTWFEVSPGVGRANKQFHSAACRTRAYRRRQVEAHRLLAEGMPKAAIAERLDVEPETLAGWLARPPGPEPGTGPRRRPR